MRFSQKQKKNIKVGGSIKTFYHGTSDVFSIKKMILPPNQTNNLREDLRKKNLDKVYFTSSQLSAEMYAKKACKKFFVLQSSRKLPV